MEVSDLELNLDCKIIYFCVDATHILPLALQLCREVERQSLANLHIIGSKLSECAQTALYRLSDRKEGDSKLGTVKYRYYCN